MIGRLNASQNATNRAPFCDAGNVERAGQGDRLVGDDADRPAVDRGERGDQVGCPSGPNLEQLAVVDEAHA